MWLIFNLLGHIPYPHMLPEIYFSLDSTSTHMLRWCHTDFTNQFSKLNICWNVSCIHKSSWFNPSCVILPARWFSPFLTSLSTNITVTTNIHFNNSEQYEIYLLSRSNRNSCVPPPSNTLSPISCAATSAATRWTIAMFLGKLRPNINTCLLTICLTGCLLLCPLPRDWVITNCILA